MDHQLIFLEASNLVNFVILRDCNTWNEEEILFFYHQIKTLFPIESSFIYCFYIWRFPDGVTMNYLDVDVAFKKIVTFTEKEDFPSLQYICSQGFVSKLLTDYKDEKSKIIECYLGFGFSLQKLFIFQLFIEIFSKTMSFQAFIYKLLRENELKYSLYRYGIFFLFDLSVCKHITKDAKQLGKFYVDQLYDKVNSLDSGLLYHYSEEFENILEFDLSKNLLMKAFVKMDSRVQSILHKIAEMFTEDKLFFEKIMDDCVEYKSLEICVSVLEKIIQKNVKPETILHFIERIYKKHEMVLISEKKKEFIDNIKCNCYFCAQMKFLCQYDSSLTIPSKINPCKELLKFTKSNPSVIRIYSHGHDIICADFHGTFTLFTSEIPKIVLELLKKKHNGDTDKIMKEGFEILKDSASTYAFVKEIMNFDVSIEIILEKAIKSLQLPGYYKNNGLFELLIGTDEVSKSKYYLPYLTEIMKRNPNKKVFDLIQNIKQNANLDDFIKPECLDLVKSVDYLIEMKY